MVSFPNRIFCNRWTPPGLWPVIWLALFFLGGTAGFSLAQESGRITGRISGGPAQGLSGTPVVALKLDPATGIPSGGGPVARTTADKQGRFVLEQVPLDPKGLYQVGARFEGRFLASAPFRFPPGKTEARADIAIAAFKTGRVEGTLVNKKTAGRIPGSTVVLVQLRLKGGQAVQVGSPQTAVSGKDGRFVFDNVPLDPGTVYRLGYQGPAGIQGSKPFAIPPDTPQVEVDMEVDLTPLPADAGKPDRWFQRVIVLLEPQTGEVRVSEYLHFLNNSGKTSDPDQQPVVLPLPADGRKLEYLVGLDAAKVTREGDHLTVRQPFPPGRTMVGIQYTLKASFGVLGLSRSYNLPVDDLAVYASQGALQVSGMGVVSRGVEIWDGASYDTWGRAMIPASVTFQAEVSGFPAQQWVYALPTMFFLVLMAGLLGWYFRRLTSKKGEDPAPKGKSKSRPAKTSPG